MPSGEGTSAACATATTLVASLGLPTPAPLAARGARAFQRAAGVTRGSADGRALCQQLASVSCPLCTPEGGAWAAEGERTKSQVSRGKDTVDIRAETGGIESRKLIEKSQPNQSRFLEQRSRIVTLQPGPLRKTTDTHYQ